jgi:hypothetical protein
LAHGCRVERRRLKDRERGDITHLQAHLVNNWVGTLLRRSFSVSSHDHYVCTIGHGRSS